MQNPVKEKTKHLHLYIFFCIGQRGIKELRKRREKGRAIVTRIHSEWVNSPAHWSLQPSFGAGSTIVCFFFVDRDERGLGKKSAPKIKYCLKTNQNIITVSKYRSDQILKT